MIRVERVLGNVHQGFRAQGETLEELWLTPWEAQKRRLRKRTPGGRDLAIALTQAGELADGDVLYAAPDVTVVARVEAGEVVVFRLEDVTSSNLLATRALRLGHVLGNQHWPVRLHRGDRTGHQALEIVVPLALDRRVVDAVIRAHQLDGVSYAFRPATPGEATGTSALGFPSQAPAPHADDVIGSVAAATQHVPAGDSGQAGAHPHRHHPHHVERHGHGHDT